MYELEIDKELCVPFSTLDDVISAIVVYLYSDIGDELPDDDYVDIVRRVLFETGEWASGYGITVKRFDI